ncbi:hypothetical protein CGCSCA4_v002937 [Colletotrichum siamense]|uniref:Uncharacterized protein n=1 Tax=Colletotrichum siamense TaxID=690259 RepID=A0A9P5EJI6_COLSI|nr:hypothetical protein CGCSCA2_v013003 [Colletotrichum siamense]KAF4852065.1 hypothetical protein CGCSCA4_v002937 [Colletotrichum siamense]
MVSEIQGAYFAGPPKVESPAPAVSGAASLISLTALNAAMFSERRYCCYQFHLEVPRPNQCTVAQVVGTAVSRLPAPSLHGHALLSISGPYPPREYEGARRRTENRHSKY